MGGLVASSAVAAIQCRLPDMPPSAVTGAAGLDLRLGPAADSSRLTVEAQAVVLALFDDCAPSLRRYVRSYGLTPEAAEDVVQEAFLALFRHLRRGGASHNLRGWLVQVSYRQALKHRERVARRQQQEMALEERAQTLVDPSEDPLSSLTTQDTQRRLQAVYRALPARDQQCLTLRAEGLRYRQIAHQLGISLGTVAKSLTRAATRLTNAVKE